MRWLQSRPLDTDYVADVERAFQEIVDDVVEAIDFIIPVGSVLPSFLMSDYFEKGGETPFPYAGVYAVPHGETLAYDDYPQLCSGILRDRAWMEWETVGFSDGTPVFAMFSGNFYVVIFTGGTFDIAYSRNGVDWAWESLGAHPWNVAVSSGETITVYATDGERAITQNGGDDWSFDSLGDDYIPCLDEYRSPSVVLRASGGYPANNDWVRACKFLYKSSFESGEMRYVYRTIYVGQSGASRIMIYEHDSSGYFPSSYRLVAAPEEHTWTHVAYCNGGVYALAADGMMVSWDYGESWEMVALPEEDVAWTGMEVAMDRVQLGKSDDTRGDRQYLFIFSFDAANQVYFTFDGIVWTGQTINGEPPFTAIFPQDFLTYSGVTPKVLLADGWIYHETGQMFYNYDFRGRFGARAANAMDGNPSHAHKFTQNRRTTDSTMNPSNSSTGDNTWGNYVGGDEFRPKNIGVNYFMKYKSVEIGNPCDDSETMDNFPTWFAGMMSGLHDYIAQALPPYTCVLAPDDEVFDSFSEVDGSLVGYQFSPLSHGEAFFILLYYSALFGDIVYDAGSQLATLTIPDARGRFLRNVESPAGVDPGDRIYELSGTVAEGVQTIVNPGSYAYVLGLFILFGDGPWGTPVEILPCPAFPVGANAVGLSIADRAIAVDASAAITDLDSRYQLLLDVPSAVEADEFRSHRHELWPSNPTLRWTTGTPVLTSGEFDGNENRPSNRGVRLLSKTHYSLFGKEHFGYTREWSWPVLGSDLAGFGASFLRQLRIDLIERFDALYPIGYEVFYVGEEKLFSATITATKGSAIATIVASDEKITAGMYLWVGNLRWVESVVNNTIFLETAATQSGTFTGDVSYHERGWKIQDDIYTKYSRVVGSLAEREGTFTFGSDVIENLFPTGISVGDPISGPSIPADTVVSAVGGYTITMSKNATNSGFETFYVMSTVDPDERTVGDLQSEDMEAHSHGDGEKDSTVWPAGGTLEVLMNGYGGSYDATGYVPVLGQTGIKSFYIGRIKKVCSLLEVSD